MSEAELRSAILMAGSLHFVQVPALFVTPSVLDWRGEITRLSSINQQIVKVVLGGIVLCVLGLGAVVVLTAGEIARTRLGGRLCGFLAIFWSYRAMIQLFVYSKSWPRSARWSHLGLCCLFPLLAGLYALGAFARGGS
jgi:hypothetical protein